MLPARCRFSFVPGVFRRLTESQDLVAWTPETVWRESRYLRWTRQGYVALAVLGIVVQWRGVARDKRMRAAWSG